MQIANTHLNWWYFIRSNPWQSALFFAFHHDHDHKPWEVTCHHAYVVTTWKKEMICTVKQLLPLVAKPSERKVKMHLAAWYPRFNTPSPLAKIDVCHLWAVHVPQGAKWPRPARHKIASRNCSMSSSPSSNCLQVGTKGLALRDLIIIV